MSVPSRTWDELVHQHVGHRDHRLYGGSQYHRVLREFNLAARCLRLPTISEDEIANAAGLGDAHDGVNFLRASCVIALEKARTSFDPLLNMMNTRMCHVMGRMCVVSEYMLKKKCENSYQRGDSSSSRGTVTDVTQNPRFRQLIREIYDKFVDQCSESAMLRCQDDLTALTRFVTWDMHDRSSGALRRSLPEQTNLVGIYQVAVQAAAAANPHSEPKSRKKTTTSDHDHHHTTTSDSLSPVESDDSSEQREYYDLLQLMEEAACSRDANRTTVLVGGLVQHIVAQWRESFGRAVTTKYNCFFLLPFMEEFHRYLRRELAKVYEEEEEDDLFDLAAARQALQQRCEDLKDECEANRRLREKFDMVSSMMQKRQQKELLDASLAKMSKEGDERR